MAKKARQRISYVLELDHSSSGGHRLGVNGLAVDRDNAILYSGGRDGVICAWDLNLDLGNHSDRDRASTRSSRSQPTTKFRASTQAHTHWVNDIVLASNNTALVSASSDLTVKVWRPSLGDAEPHTIGQHADYVKCVATPSSADWVASGGLDRKIYLWDLNGKGKSLEIDVRGEDVSEKASVYAMSVGRNILASGGPESIVRLWDPKSGKRITKFVGHTDNIRAILMNEAGDTVMTASSDQTVKVWSVTAGRCVYTLTMHNDSVWSLFSEHPELAVLYSSDRSGLIVKTDTRGVVEMDEGLSVAVAQEHDGVSKVVACGDYIWTATSSSSINRWTDVDTGPDAQLPEPFRHLRVGSPFSRSTKPPTASGDEQAKHEIPAKSILRISNTAIYPPELDGPPEPHSAPGVVSRKGSEIADDSAVPAIEPIHHLPEETVEGQNGLVKHKLLNDRRRVLTLDTAGDVLLWDLIRCEVIQRFGKKHLEDVEPSINTLEAVAPWCSIDTSSGNLTVVLEPFNCFDAEMYADELVLAEPVEFREDQRINLGRWILRYLFAKLIDEEIKRDEVHRQKLNEGVENRRAASRLNPPISIPLSAPNVQGWEPSDSPVTTPRANGANLPMSPGLAIGLATPASNLPGISEGIATPVNPLERVSIPHHSWPSGDDYFSGGISSVDATAKAGPAPTPAPADQPPAKEETPKTPVETKEKEKDGAKSPSTPFAKKFRMGMSFGSKKLGKSAAANVEKPVATEEKPEENKSESSSNHEKEVDDNLRGVIQKIHNEYEKQLLENPDNTIETKITPALPIDAPVLKLPSGTKVIIQEETSGGSANLYRGTVMTVGVDADIIEEKAPVWLGEVLLTNTIPQKEPVKISFVLYPWKDSLPSIAAADGNNRLNANRMLRVKKILAYIAERIDPTYEEAGSDALKPEEYMELYCNDQLLPSTMSLATLRAHIWKGGNDVVLYYKANGRKEIPKELPKPQAVEEPAAPEAGGQPAAATTVPSPIATVG
ncbi:WD40 repeat-like protein [Durotheca rogersii]|uniref:WD40 repeat-like protein n=1 Tax=Durotheca rogersii TaxID=419775 RepID=UPI0022201102|nr:WD40 repeat-like protein [Durotheca rogersii]KAI5864152.1 WD40 repeat-like protein [Durotheca rogersii]